jgi:hypothetical protein
MPGAHVQGDRRCAASSRSVQRAKRTGSTAPATAAQRPVTTMKAASPAMGFRAKSVATQRTGAPSPHMMMAWRYARRGNCTHRKMFTTIHAARRSRARNSIMVQLATVGRAAISTALRASTESRRWRHGETNARTATETEQENERWRTADKLMIARPNRDRRKPHGLPLPHHRTYGSRIRRFDELNSYRGARLGSPKVSKKRNGSANANAGVFDSRHGPCADLLVFHASRTDTPRLRSSR